MIRPTWIHPPSIHQHLRQPWSHLRSCHPRHRLQHRQRLHPQHRQPSLRRHLRHPPILPRRIRHRPPRHQRNRRPARSHPPSGSSVCSGCLHRTAGLKDSQRSSNTERLRQTRGNQGPSSTARRFEGSSFVLPTREFGSTHPRGRVDQRSSVPKGCVGVRLGLAQANVSGVLRAPRSRRFDPRCRLG